MAHGEFKTVGGKLVVADFDIVSGKLRNIVISGDFFLEPAEALDTIRDALDGTDASTSENELAEKIRSALPGHVSMIGFSPQAVATAVRRGIE